MLIKHMRLFYTYLWIYLTHCPVEKFPKKALKILRIIERNYYSSLLEKQKANFKETWKILNVVINKRNNKPTYPEFFIKKPREFPKKDDIAN